MLLRDEDNKEIVLFHLVIYNSVVESNRLLKFLLYRFADPVLYFYRIRPFNNTHFTCSEYVDYPGPLYMVPFVGENFSLLPLPFPFPIFDLVHMQLIGSF